MKLLTFYDADERLVLGVRTEGGVLDVPAAAAACGLAGVPATVDAVLAGGPAAVTAVADCVAAAVREQARVASCFRDEASLRLGPCVPSPGKIICVGLNYKRHAAESNMDVPQSPVLFSKYANTLCGPGAAIPVPVDGVQIDYEAELAVVIGRRATRVTQAEALDHVFGYCNANDLSVRDLQFRTGQWLLGKSLDGFGPVGPYLVTGDEVGDPQALGIRCWVNGELRQNSTTADMIFPCDYIVSYISHYMTLEPGDIILTGTPEGVVLGMKEKRWVAEGDVMTVEVDKLGSLTNSMGKPAALGGAAQGGRAS